MKAKRYRRTDGRIQRNWTALFDFMQCSGILTQRFFLALPVFFSHRGSEDTESLGDGIAQFFHAKARSLVCGGLRSAGRDKCHLSGPRYARQKPFTAQRFMFTQERGPDPDSDTDPDTDPQV